uniref:Uncharacterized protein n=1 Tax=Arundo donax TaxID=35708 RepID=A0A0A9H579_ARUDO
MVSWPLMVDLAFLFSNLTVQVTCIEIKILPLFTSYAN